MSLNAASFTMEEVSKGRRDPDEGVVVQQLAMSPDPGKQVVRWNLVSTEPTRADPGVAPRWQLVEAVEAVWLQRRPWPFALRQVRGVCGRDASRHVQVRSHLDQVLHRVGEEVPEGQEVQEVPPVAVVA